MAFATVNHTAAIWQAWGLKYIFRPGPELKAAAQWSHTAEAKNSAPPRRPAPATPPRDVAKDPAKAPAFRPVPREAWPQIWQEQWKCARPGKVAWTYWQLGADLLGEGYSQFDASGRDRRRKIMGRLLADLGHPGGTHTFWPAQLEGEGQADIFWSGVKALGCRGLLIFGSQAAWSLLKSSSVRPLNEYRQWGIFVWVLRDLDALGEDVGHYRQTVAFLRSQLQIFLR